MDNYVKMPWILLSTCKKPAKNVKKLEFHVQNCYYL